MRRCSHCHQLHSRSGNLPTFGHRRREPACGHDKAWSAVAPLGRSVVNIIHTVPKAPAAPVRVSRPSGSSPDLRPRPASGRRAIPPLPPEAKLPAASRPADAPDAGCRTSPGSSDFHGWRPRGLQEHLARQIDEDRRPVRESPARLYAGLSIKTCRTSAAARVAESRKSDDFSHSVNASERAQGGGFRTVPPETSRSTMLCRTSGAGATLPPEIHFRGSSRSLRFHMLSLLHSLPAAARHQK